MADPDRVIHPAGLAEVEVLATANTQLPTLLESDREIANSLGLTQVEAVKSVGSVGNDSQLPRREWRIVANTGDLRGVCWRERNSERKVVRYVGKRNKPEEFRAYTSAYEGWRRTNRSLDGAGLVTAAVTVGKGQGPGVDGQG